MKRKKVEPFTYNKKGEIIGFNLHTDAANDDWIRATRLKQVVIGLNNFLKLIEKG